MEQHKLNLHEPIDFIFDEDSEKTKIPRGWELMKDAARDDIRSLMGDMPIFRDDEKTMPLQAADLYAWWAFKWQREGVKNWATDLPFPWPKNRNIARMAVYFGAKSFLYDISKMLENLARNPQELEYAKSIMPEGWDKEPFTPADQF
jgi:hypothetical protein